MNQRIRELREAAGLSQAELARRVGVTSTAVQHWESEKNPIRPRASARKKLAEVLGASELYLEFGYGDGPREKWRNLMVAEHEAEDLRRKARTPAEIRSIYVLSPTEQALIAAFRALAPTGQSALIAFLRQIHREKTSLRIERSDRGEEGEDLGAPGAPEGEAESRKLSATAR